MTTRFGRIYPTRRVLARAEAMNAITVDSLNADQLVFPNLLPAYNFDVWANSGLCSVSSALGPGHNGATKLEILVPGGRHHVNLSPQGDHHHPVPLTTNAATFGGIAVATPPSTTSVGPDIVARSIGTSVAAALATGIAARAHEALEAAYPGFGALPSAQRACLLEALLVHGAPLGRCARSASRGARAACGQVSRPPEGQRSPVYRLRCL